MDKKELTGEEYQSLTPREMIEWLNSSMATIHKFKNDPVSTEEDKFFLQFAFDVMNATRNGLLESLPKEETKSVIVAAKKGDAVKATSGLMFRNTKPKR